MASVQQNIQVLTGSVRNGILTLSCTVFLAKALAWFHITYLVKLMSKFGLSSGYK